MSAVLAEIAPIVGTPRDRLARVRGAMREAGVAALLVPTGDPHLSEFPSEHWRARQWLSGFSGTVGTLVVGLDRAALFADGRYWVQAEEQLTGSGIELVRIPVGPSSAHVQWLVEHLSTGQRVAVDARSLSLNAALELKRRLHAAGIALETGFDLVGETWGTQRPPLPMAAIYEHAKPWAPVGRADKLETLRNAMRELGASHHFISTLDDIAWLTNLRGSDVPCNPVFSAHLLVEPQAATLFVTPEKLDAALQQDLAANGVAVQPYAEAGASLATLPAEAVLLIDPARCSLGLLQHVPAGVRQVQACNPSTLMKSRKSSAEARHVREAMIEDGAAMCEFYAAFEASLARGERWDEMRVHEELSAERARRAGFMDLSFHTIVAFKAHGALPHYVATPQSNAQIVGNGLLLIDSGGQYLGGTTDVTRVWPIGRITDAMRRDFTLVLKGMMNLSRARFPRGTPGPMLDALARAPLWAQGLDYDHGTGHGVGYFLHVHEGPHTISRVQADPSMAFEPGMITSIEPGIYRPGQWGIRIENLALAQPAPPLENGQFGEMLEFETLTLCPIDARCVLPSLLSADELAWLNDYHRKVRERLLPKLSAKAAQWLIARTVATGR